MNATPSRRDLQVGAAASPEGRELLQLDAVEVRFGANIAVFDVSLSLASGEIIGLMGANGAGKSTLAKVITGEIPYGSYTGTMRCMGMPATFSSARAAHRAGITLVHQEGSVVPQLSIGENVMLTIEPSRLGIVNWGRLHSDAAVALERVGTRVDTHSKLGAQGGVAMMELTEIARAIARGSLIFVFDESTSALGAEEISILFQRMRELASQGAGIIFISHRIDEVLQVCTRVVVLRDGQLSLDAPCANICQDQVIRAMLGQRTVSESIDGPSARLETRRPVLTMRQWRVEQSGDSSVCLGPIDLEIAEGEIVALYGPLGSGKAELLRSIFGLSIATASGELSLMGEPFAPSSPGQSVESGIAYVSAERQRDGLVPQLSVLENMMLGWHRGCPKRFGLIVDHFGSGELCRSFIRDLGIRATGPDQPISALSGGNQQKVLLSRALINEPRLVLLDEPTRGIDIGAKQDVYRLIRTVASKGTAVLYATLEEGEALELADRILVMRDGLPVRLLRACETNPHELLSLAGGL